LWRDGGWASISFEATGYGLKRIGLFGGTFNPIHNGHLWAATSVLEGFGLDSVVLIPAAIPPHKRTKEIAPATDRLEMIRLSVADHEHLAVSDVELVRSGPSYSVDTVRHFRERSTEDQQFFFIVGMDAFLEIDTWKYFEDLFTLIPMVVLNRPVSLQTPGDSFYRVVHDFLQTRISEGYSPSTDGFSFFHPHQQTVYLFPGEMMDISSTLIRQHIGRGESVSDVIPRSAVDFIRRKGLYR
jgi:nicotinate-nucleotide adenylyltransferase